MNYKRIYNNIITQATNSNRSKKTHYYERHHIVPVFMFKNNKRYKTSIGEFPGNPDSPNNLVLLTTREHFLAHLLLCKIYKNTKYYYGCLCSLFLMSNKFKKNSEKLNFNRNQYITKISSSRIYLKIREEAREVISSARKGKIVCKDINTGKIIGSIDRNHPKIKSGEWVHHTHGTKLNKSRIKQISENTSGYKNPNSSGIKNETILNEYLILCEKLKEIPSLKFFKRVWNKKYEIQFPKYLTKFRFNNGKDLPIIASNKLGYPLPNKAPKHFAQLDPINFI